MAMLRQLAIRLRALLRRSRMERELDEELRYHLDRDAEGQVARGVMAADARLAARRSFGNVGVLQEAVRDSWGLRWLHEFGQDAAYALRSFARSPGFTLTVVGTIALGLGLNSTIFTLFNAYVLRPLPVRDPAALYEPSLVQRDGAMRRFTWPEYQDLRDHNAVFTGTFAYAFAMGRMSGAPVFVQLVTGDYFPMLGVGAALGRTLLPEDVVAPGALPVVVLSHRMWQSRFGGDSGILGRRVLINGVSLEVVGVARSGFEGQGVPIDCWGPLTLLDRLRGGSNIFGTPAPPAVMVIGRLRSGISPAQARGALGSWARAITADQPDSARAMSVQLDSRATMVPLNRDIIAAAVPIAVAFLLVMLIACANVANMMLARGLARQREIGIRLSLGAARARLIRQLLTESVLLAIPAAAAGFGLSRVTLDVGARIMFASLPAEFASLIHVIPLPPDWRVVGFMFGTAVLAAVLFGLAPALQATRTDVVQASRGNLDTPRRTAGLRNALVVAQITVCGVLLIIAGILLRGARQMEHLDAGVRARDALEITVSQPFRGRVLERLRREPDVALIAAGRSMPFGGIFPREPLVSDQTSVGSVYGGFNAVTPTYFAVLDIPILHGRNFTEAEARAGAPVAIVSEGAARALWPGRDPLGETVRMARDGSGLVSDPLGRFRVATVIGVARNAVAGWLGLRREWPVVYYPTSAEDENTTVLIRVLGEAERGRRALDRSLAEIDSGAVLQIHKVEELRAVQVYPFRAAYWVSSILAGVALLLTLSGVYGVLSYVIAQRTREIGIRMALGATTLSVLSLVLRQMGRLAGIGLVVGLVLALGASKLLNSYLFMVNTFDPLGYMMGGAAVLLACVAAAVVPSYRAAAVQPVTTLRHD